MESVGCSQQMKITTTISVIANYFITKRCYKTGSISY